MLPKMPLQCTLLINTFAIQLYGTLLFALKILLMNYTVHYKCIKNTSAMHYKVHY